MRFSFDLKDFVDQQIEPEKLAVISEQEELTWLAFESRVNALCQFFQSRGWDKTGRPTILYGHKKADMIVAVYACMKMEIPYIPVDVVYPRERVVSVYKIAEVDLVVNCTGKSLELPGTTEISLSHNGISFYRNQVDCQFSPHEKMIRWYI